MVKKMREILFRGIPKDDTTRHFFADIWKDDCKGSFVYGSLIISKDRYYICVSALCQINSCINNGMTSMIEVIPETVGQYTGLCDKNGKKIFEGDILKSVFRWLDMPKNGVVAFRDGAFGFIWYRGDVEMFHPFTSVCNVTYEVIGNIHDNPELLKGGAE